MFESEFERNLFTLRMEKLNQIGHLGKPRRNVIEQKIFCFAEHRGGERLQMPFELGQQFQRHAESNQVAGIATLLAEAPDAVVSEARSTEPVLRISRIDPVPTVAATPAELASAPWNAAIATITAVSATTPI